MMQRRTVTARIKRLARNTILALSGTVVVLAPSPLSPGAGALTDQQRKAFSYGAGYYNSEESSCGTELGGATDTLPGNIPATWRTLLTKAAASRDTSASLLAAIYLTENGNEWRPFTHPWASSGAGAVGPFQFLPSTWEGHKADGDGDGKMDVLNVVDAAFGAADMIADIGAKPDSPLGTLDAPLARNTLLYVAIAYNAGPGFAERSDPTITLDGITQATGKPEASEYAMNVFTVIDSRFTKSGKPAYADPHSAMTTDEAGNIASDVEVCGEGAQAIVQLAMSLAWDSRGHGPLRGDAKPNYPPFLEQYNSAFGGDCTGSGCDPIYSDCGAFVGSVIAATGVDPDYPTRGTYNQMPYLNGSQSRWEVINDIRDDNYTELLRPGDVLIFHGDPGTSHGHTYIYVGPQTAPDGTRFTSVGASYFGHVPEIGGINMTQNQEDGNGVMHYYHFSVARLRG